MPPPTAAPSSTVNQLIDCKSTHRLDINVGDAMVKLRVIGSAVLVLGPALSVWAHAPPAPPPPMGVWIGKAQFGFLDSHGNADAESINGNVDMVPHDNAWNY